jgi:hypothetical protein
MPSHKDYPMGQGVGRMPHVGCKQDIIINVYFQVVFVVQMYKCIFIFLEDPQTSIKKLITQMCRM